MQKKLCAYLSNSSDTHCDRAIELPAHHLWQRQRAKAATDYLATREIEPILCGCEWRGSTLLVAFCTKQATVTSGKYEFGLLNYAYAPNILRDKLWVTIRDKHLWIDDIVVSLFGQGHGTLLLNAAIQFACEQHLSYVAGNLSPIDLVDHAERLLHFYRKNGFVINGNSIHLEL